MPQPQYPKGYGMGMKHVLPKRPVVQINIGMGRPQPFGVPIAPIGLMPHGPKHLHMPGRGYKNPVGEIIDFVNDPVGYMVEKSLGLRSNKPGEKKEGDAEKKEGEEKVEAKEENKATQNEIVTEQKQEPVLRARKKETEEQQEYEEVEYAEEPELEAQQEQAQTQQEAVCPECTGENVCPECANENLFPECTGENLCPEYTGENLCPECTGENLCPECSGTSLCPECSNGKTVKETKTVKAKTQFNNFNFHEIVETSDNTKSYVVVKKGGVTISES
jgi:hypothetical protein